MQAATKLRLSIDYEAINDEQSSTQSVSRTLSIFDDLGVSRSSVGASARGALQTAANNRVHPVSKYRTIRQGAERAPSSQSAIRNSRKRAQK